MPRFAIATAFFLATAGLLLSGSALAQSKKCKPPLVCKPTKATKPPKTRSCPYGKVRSVDTRGKCCWPGQLYSKRKKRCVGTPERCPSPLVAGRNACVNPVRQTGPRSTKRKTQKQKSCNFGMSRTVDTRGQCCWPGQVSDGNTCVGEPVECPAGFNIGSDRCIPSNCAAGQIKPDGVHCCYPGNRWSASANACVGPSPCPSGTYRRGKECLWPESWNSDDLRLAGDCGRGNGTLKYENGLQCCWPGQLWSSLRKVCVGKARQCPSATEDGGYIKRDGTCVFTTRNRALSAEERRGAVVDAAVKKAVKDALSDSDSRPVRERYTSSLSLAGASLFYGLRWTENFASDFAFVTQIMGGITFMGAAGFHWYFAGDTTSFYLLAKGGVVDGDEFYFDFGLGYEWTVDHFVMQIEIGGMGWDGEIELWLGGLSLGGRW